MDISVTSDNKLMVDGKILPFTFYFMMGFYNHFKFRCYT